MQVLKHFYVFGAIALLVLSGMSMGEANLAHAASFTAVQSGDWDNPATWGGVDVPEQADDVTIPVGITVTLGEFPTTFRSGQTIVDGTFVAEDGLTNFGTFQNNGTLTAPNGFVNDGTFTNAGTFTNDVLFHNLGTLTNTVTGVIINNFTFFNVGEGTVVFNNAGTFTNNSNGTLVSWTTITNTGSISNAGVIELYCSASITGNAVTGNAPVYLGLPRPALGVPAHRTHTTDRTPDFTWDLNTVANVADSYRLMIYRADRSFEFKKRVFTSQYTLAPTEWLANGQFLWRVRTQFEACPIWSGWSGRNTLFIE